MELFVYCPKCGKLVKVEGEAGATVHCQCHTELVIPDGHDVFVSYSSKDLQKVEELAGEFSKAKINFWLAPDQIGPGAGFPAEISLALERAKILVLVLSENSVESHWVKREVLVAHDDRRIPVMPLWANGKFPLSKEWKLLLKIDQRAEEIPTLIRQIHQQLPRSDDPEEKIMVEQLRKQAQPIERSEPRGADPQICPYVGPTPYQKDSTHRLYGRFPVARELCLAIRRHHLTLVYAPSGAGKSSLFNTLIQQTFSDPGLGYKVHANLRVGTTPPEAAEKTSNYYAYSAITSFNDLEAKSEPNLTNYLASRKGDRDAPRRILIFDQFEELFTKYAEPFAKASELHKQRGAFLDDLILALESDEFLHIVLVIREEYLAGMNRWLRGVSDKLLYRFPLNRLGREDARDAIVCPAVEYAAYDRELVDGLLDQLEAEGAIEMVHLQIVCQRLWETLPAGVKLITKEHVENAPGSGGTCQGFVKNAVKTFYKSVVEEVADKEPPAGQRRFPEELIYLGCKKFVASQSIRTVLRQDRERTGRLPNWIVQDLENKHLLRSETRGETLWYELSHDLLIRSVEDQSNPNVTALLYAAELLDTTIEAARYRNNQTLQDYFSPHADLLRASQPFKLEPVLFEDEAEFLFRASLVTGGEEMMAWSDLLEKTYSVLQKNYLVIHQQVLTEALKAKAILGLLTREEAAFTRRNAAILLGERPAIMGLLDLLTDVALNDENSDTRSAASFALVQRQDAEKYYDEVINKLQGPAVNAKAPDTLARMRVAADRIRPAENQLDSAPVFTAVWRNLKWLTRIDVRLRGWFIRLKEGFSAVPYIFFPAALLSSAIAAPWKTAFARVNWGICQAKPSAGMGFFHGITAAVIWGGGIALALALYGLIFRTERHGNNAFRPLGAVLTGALAGFLCSAMLVILIANVYDLTPLCVMGWVTDLGRERFCKAMLVDLFVSPGFGWPYLFTGTGLGIGMAMMTNHLLASRTWLKFLDEEVGELSGISHVLGLIWQIIRLALPYFFWIPPVLALSAFLAYTAMQNVFPKQLTPPKEFLTEALAAREPVPKPTTSEPPAEKPLTNLDFWKRKTSSRGLAEGLISDCSTQALGSFFAVVGMGLGMVIMRRGFRVNPRSDKPWRSAPLRLPEPAP